MALVSVIEQNPHLLTENQKSAWKICSHALELMVDAKEVIKRIDEYEDPESVSELLKVKSFRELMKSMKNRLMGTWFCRIRGCPVCEWRKWMVHSLDLKEVLEVFLTRHGYKFDESGKDAPFLFFTVTMENVPKSGLRSAIEKLANGARFLSNKVFDRYTPDQYPDWKFVHGMFRKVEITYNEKEDTYHPHMHYILAIDVERYYRGGYFKSHGKYSDIWKRISGFSIVDIRAVKDIQGGVLEIAKYATKSTDFFPKEDPYKPRNGGEVWVAVKEATAGKQMFAYTGELAEIRKELRHDKRSKKEEDQLMLSVGFADEIADYSHLLFLKYDDESHDFRNY
jgi:plasmid rolling circle replication initiator protein Rep